MNIDLFIPSTILLVGVMSYRCMMRYADTETVKLKTELDAIQIRVSLFASKVAIVEQYIEEFWKTIPSDEQEEIEDLLLTRAYLERAMDEAWQLYRVKDNETAWFYVRKLRGEHVILDSDLDRRSLVKWEEKTHKLILKVCQKLTIEASVSKTKQTPDSKYKRTPTLLSLKEISELLREERSLRHEFTRPHDIQPDI